MGLASRPRLPELCFAYVSWIFKEVPAALGAAAAVAARRRLGRRAQAAGASLESRSASA